MLCCLERASLPARAMKNNEKEGITFLSFSPSHFMFQQSAQFNLQELSCVFLDELKVCHGIWMGWIWLYISGDTRNQCPEHLLCSPLPCPRAWHRSIAIKLIATEKALYPCAPCYSKRRFPCRNRADGCRTQTGLLQSSEQVKSCSIKSLSAG